MRRLLVTLALALTAAGARAADEDFEEEQPLPSIALGPVRTASAVLSADVGWLRSGLRADFGLGGGFDLGVRGDGFVLPRGTSGQNAVYAGLRYSPFDGTGFRLTGQFELGIVFVPQVVGSRDLFVLRGEVLAGYPVVGFLPYARAAFRALHFDAASYAGWDRDGEAAAGVERALGHLVVAGEVGGWFQPDVRGTPQWRIRAGWAF